MTALLASWVLIALWSEWRRRPRGRLRDLRRAPEAEPSPIRWPRALIRFGLVGTTLRRRASRRRRADRLRRALPETLDILGLAMHAGLVPAEALAAAAETGHPPLDRVLGDAVTRLRRGGSWDEVVSQLGGDLGPDGRGLELLLRGEGGAPLADGIDRLAVELRDRHRREVQRRAQRLPVTVLAPLVTCILPAFLLITIVPVVSTLGGDVIQDLPLGATP